MEVDMTEQEAINIFNGFKFLPREQKAVEMSIEALKKQVPQKPIEERNADMTNSWYVCPVCNRMAIKSADYFYNHCCRCGQKLDWSNDDKAGGVDE